MPCFFHSKLGSTISTLLPWEKPSLKISRLAGSKFPGESWWCPGFLPIFVGLFQVKIGKPPKLYRWKTPMVLSQPFKCHEPSWSKKCGSSGFGTSDCWSGLFQSGSWAHRGGCANTFGQISWRPKTRVLGPKGSWQRESSYFRVSLGWWNTIIWPRYMAFATCCYAFANIFCEILMNFFVKFKPKFFTVSMVCGLFFAKVFHLHENFWGNISPGPLTSSQSTPSWNGWWGN